MVVCLFPPAPCGGAELQCWKQARALAKRGHDVTVLTEWILGSSARREVRDGVTLRRLGFFLPVTSVVRRLHRWLRLKMLAPAADRPDPFSADWGQSVPGKPTKKFRWMAPVEWMGHLSFILEAGVAVKLGRLKAEVVHVHESHWLAGFGQWMAETMGVPVFCKEALQPVLLGGIPDVPWREAWKTRRMKCAYLAMHSGIAADLESAGIPRDQIARVPNGVEIPVEAATPERCADAIYMGNFTQGGAHKAFDVLIQACAKAQRLEPGVRLHLYGGGDSRRWKAYAAEQGCGMSVVFEGKTEDVVAAHRQGGCLLLPSRMEGLSNSLLEAMASGLPAVVSDIPGNVAAIRDGVEGIVVPVGDADALADAMVRLCRSPELRARMGRAARMRAQEVFSIDKVAAQLEEAYGQAIRKPNGGTMAEKCPRRRNADLEMNLKEPGRAEK